MIFCRYISPIQGLANVSPVASGTVVSSLCHAKVDAGNSLKACWIFAWGGGYLYNNQSFKTDSTGIVFASRLPKDVSEGLYVKSVSLKYSCDNIIFASAWTAAVACPCAFFALTRRTVPSCAACVFNFTLDVTTHHNFINFIISPLKKFQDEKKHVQNVCLHSPRRIDADGLQERRNAYQRKRSG